MGRAAERFTGLLTSVAGLAVVDRTDGWTLGAAGWFLFTLGVLLLIAGPAL